MIVPVTDENLKFYLIHENGILNAVEKLYTEPYMNDDIRLNNLCEEINQKYKSCVGKDNCKSGTNCTYMLKNHFCVYIYCRDTSGVVLTVILIKRFLKLKIDLL